MNKTCTNIYTNNLVHKIFTRCSFVSIVNMNVYHTLSLIRVKGLLINQIKHKEFPEAKTSRFSTANHFIVTGLSMYVDYNNI